MKSSRDNGIHIYLRFANLRGERVKFDLSVGLGAIIGDKK
jgi:hypothetical protein